jgi:nucleoside-diphosphate-sugar epimerase
MRHTQTVWVIGANSFTGKYLVPALQKSAYRVATTHVDITHAQAVEKAMLDIQPQYVINLAAISFVPDGEDESIYAVNTFGPQNILSACLKLPHSPKNIILASSANVYGVQVREQMDEACFPNPVNHYGCSKWSMEQIAKTYSDRLPITITRPFNYTGRGQDMKFLVPKIVEHFKHKAETIKLGNIDVWRDFSDVRWIAQAYTKLLSTSNQGLNTVNLCSGKLLSIRDIIELLQQITGHTLKVETDSSLVRQADIKRQYGDNQKLFSLTPKLLVPVEFKETLKWMVHST